MDRTESSSLRDILGVVFKHWRSIAAIFAVATVTAIVAVALATPQYTATSRLLVQVGREKTASFAVESKAAANVSLLQRAQDINNEVEILRDPSLVTKLLPEIKEKLAGSAGARTQPRGGFKQSLSSMVTGVSRTTLGVLHTIGWPESPRLTADEELAARINEAIEIDFPKDTDIINVNVRWSDPAFAAYLANTVVRVFLEEHVRIHAIEHSTSYYEDQLAHSRERLANAEQSLADFMRDGQISNLEAEKSLALNILADTDKELNQARVALDGITQKLATTERSYNSSNEWIETLDPDSAEAGIKALDESFVTLSTQRTQLLGRFSASYPAVVNIEGQLKQLREAKYIALKARYTARRGEILDRIANLQAKIAAKRDDLRRLGDRTLEYERAVRLRDQVQAETAEYRQKVDDLRVRDGLDARVITSIKIISDAVAPIRPSAPKKTLIVSAAAIAGLFFGLAFAILAEFFNHTFRSERDVRRILDVPLLATVPYVNRWAP